MNPKQLEKLNNLLALLKEDTVGPKEIEQFLLLILDVIKKTKVDFEDVSQQRLKVIDDALEILKGKQDIFLSNIQDEIEKKKKDIIGGFNVDIADTRKDFFVELEAVQEAIKELSDLSAELKAIEIRDGKDGKDGKDADQNAIVAEVLTKIKFPDPVVLDGPMEIRNKLETLTGPERLKATAIDGLEEFVDARILEVAPKGGIFRNTIGGGVTQIKAGAGVTISSTGANGRGVVTISASGGSSVADGDYGDITVSSSGTVWTIDNLAVTNAKINDVAWGKITGTPTTLAGYGITDAIDGTGGATLVAFFLDSNTLTTDSHFTYDGTNHVLHVHVLAGDATDGLIIESANGTNVGILGAGNSANVSWAGAHNFAVATQDTIAAFIGAGKTLSSLALATYPSLTELSYVKGVTSSIQTQINSKGSGTVTNTGGNLTSNAVVLGAGTVDTKVVAGITTDGTSMLVLGVNATTLGKLKMFGSTSGDVTLQPSVIAGTATVLSLPAYSETLATLGGVETLTNKTLTAPKIASGGFIADINGNEQIIFTTTASAVNEVTFANAATGNNPKFTASGGDSNIGFDFQTKGSGVYRFLGTSTQAAELRLYEDTDDGTNYTAFKVGTQAGDLTYTLPTAYPAVTGYVLSATTAGVMSWISPGGIPTQITVANEATDTTCFPLFVTAATGDLGPKSNSAFTFNSNTGALASTLFAADTITANTNFVPDANDGAGLGTASLQFSDLFLAEGAVINWDNGDATITQTGNDITVAGITTFGLGTSTALTTGTIELGHASDTTIARVSAGVVSIEGVTIDTISAANTLTNKTLTDAVNNISSPGTTTVGYLGIPQNSKSAAYTTVMSDAGKHILHPAADTTARTFTIDSNANVAYPIGTAITFINENGAGTVTIAITSDTMRLAGAGTTGSRTLAANGVATAVKITSTSWIISGTNLT